MELKLERYEKYRDSGVEWLGEIPESWEVKRLKFLIIGKLKYGANESGIQYNSSLPRYIRITDFGENGKLNEEKKLSLSWKKGGEYLLKDGDILFARSGATVGKTYQFKKSFSAEDHYSYAGYLIKAEPDEHKILSDLLFYYTNSSFFNIWKNIIFNKATIENIGADKYSQLPVVVPLLNEQTAIAQFLDKKNTLIDQAITQKEQLIELLKERRQILIHQAVTRGLNPDVEMKDSEVEWIGEIPKHWEVVRNAVLFSERNEAGNENLPLLSVSIHTAVSSEEISEEDNIRGKVRIQNKSSYKLVEIGDITFNMMRAWQGAIGVVRTKGMVSPAYIVAKKKGILNSEFVEYLFRTDNYIQQINRFSRGITDFRKRLYWNEFKNLYCFLPTIEEQNEIVEFIQSNNVKIEKTITIQSRQIQKLKEYKITLINAAVTGKIKIPS